MLRSHSLVAAMLLGCLAAVSNAAIGDPITETFAFRGSFSMGPYNDVSGRATLSFDPSVSQNISPLLSFSSTLPTSYGPFYFMYDAPSPGDGGKMWIGDNCPTNTCFVQSGKDQAFIVFQLDSGGAPEPSSGNFLYSTVSYRTRTFAAEIVTVTLATGTAVPEPASLTLCATALLGLMFVVRQRA